MSSTLDNVNTRIRVELARSRRNQTDLAKLLGLSQAGVSRRLSGVTPWDLLELELVAEFFGVPLPQFVASDDVAATAP